MSSAAQTMSESSQRDYGLGSSLEVLLTSEAGARLDPAKNLQFYRGNAESGARIRVHPERIRQALRGIGTSFSEAAAFVLAHLEPERRVEVMRRIFGEDGANFSLARTPIGSTDFSVEGKYCYAPIADDVNLRHFSIAPDCDGFSRNDYPGIRDEGFDLLPMIREAMAIKRGQRDGALDIVASAWTAPAWMKDIEDWYRPGSGGALKPEHARTYARYLIKYLQAYRDQGVPIRGLTPVNEPLGNSGQWESMHFSAESQRDFIRDHLGPELGRNGFGQLQLLILDHSRTELEHWAEVIYSDPDAAKYVSGAAVHWYESSFRVYEDVFDRVHAKYPRFSIVHTEGCIDDLGKPAPPGVRDPAGYQESGWFGNDAFWWNDNASDWAYSVTWEGVDAAEHPLYTPVHRYARNIIVSLNHWVEGWIDWNIVLDERGGPNHVGNYCGAPIMIDTRGGEIYYTPVFYILAQLSRTIRPGDRAVQTDSSLDGLDSDALHACATLGADDVLAVQVLNTGKSPIGYRLQLGCQQADVEIPANALQTVRLPVSRSRDDCYRAIRQDEAKR